MSQQIDSDLLDIINGYSKIEVTPDIFYYYKHPTILELLELERFYGERLKEAKKNGVLTREQLIENAIKCKAWTKNDEEFIKTTLWEIDKLSKATEKIIDPLQKKMALQRVEEKENQVEERKSRREELLKLSAENLAEAQKFNRLVITRCFRDKKFSEKFDLKNIGSLSDVLNKLNNHNYLTKIAYTPIFFEVFSIHQDSAEQIFGKASFNLTVYQKNLIVLAGILMSKLENYGHEMDENKKAEAMYVYNYKPKTEKEKQQKVSNENDLLQKARSGKSITAEDLLS